MKNEYQKLMQIVNKIEGCEFPIDIKNINKFSLKLYKDIDLLLKKDAASLLEMLEVSDSDILKLHIAIAVYNKDSDKKFIKIIKGLRKSKSLLVSGDAENFLMSIKYHFLD